MNVIAQRQKQIDDAIAAAETPSRMPPQPLTSAEDKLRNVDAEAAARREAYEQQAEKEKQQLMADAQKQADAIVAEGKAAAEAERQHKLREADAHGPCPRHVREAAGAEPDCAGRCPVCWTICWRKQVLAMATEFSKGIFYS